MRPNGSEPYPQSAYPVETAAPVDLISIAHLNVWAYREFAVDLGPEAWPELVRVLTSVEPGARAGTFLVVRSQDGLLGSVAYLPPGRAESPLPQRWASVALLAVAPPARGQGVGASLVNACLVRAKQDRAATLGAVVGGYLAGAQGFFTRLGFHREQGLPRRGEPAYWLYRKDLKQDLEEGVERS